jgi:3-dehydroquinate synthetase
MSQVAVTQWSMRDIEMGDVRFPYYVGYDCLDRIAHSLLAADADRFLLVTDTTVERLHGDRLVEELSRHAPVTVLSKPPGEATKSLACLSEHLERALAAGASRASMVVTLGGGVPGNLGGMLAALLYRGIRLVHIPTTTVAAMDSVLSLKQAVNSPFGKNHIGCYHAPTAVYADVATLLTLPERELRSGLCEMAKNCLAIRPQALTELHEILGESSVASEEAFEWMLEEGIAAKSLVMRRDPHERHAGLVLEYGHTVGHAIEYCHQRRWGSHGISHGEAISLGMVVAARISRAIGVLDDDAVALHEGLAAALGVPPEMPDGISLDEVLAVVAADNKRGYLKVTQHEAAMVLLRALGVPLGPVDRPLVAVDLELVEDAVAGLILDSRVS